MSRTLGPGADLLAGVRRQAVLGCQHETVVLTPHGAGLWSGASAAAPDHDGRSGPEAGRAAVTVNRDPGGRN
ncbi:hypothetical protein [Streptomyces sp. NPDC001401]|uniref:hypothetical protein n=1 Tax=Streptomyces sp. NPDC001401 TaxID=3364570 RepID=UPI0036BF4105